MQRKKNSSIKMVIKLNIILQIFIYVKLMSILK